MFGLSVIRYLDIATYYQIKGSPFRTVAPQAI